MRSYKWMLDKIFRENLLLAKCATRNGVQTKFKQGKKVIFSSLCLLNFEYLLNQLFMFDQVMKFKT